MYEYDNPKIKYIDVYQYRVDRYGANHKEREYNYNVKKFEKYLQSHPSSQNVFIDNTETLASIISNKQDQYKLTKQILTSINSNIHPGSIIDWDNDKWIVYQKEHQPNQTYNSCYMIQCNKEIKWIDDYGVERIVIKNHNQVFHNRQFLRQMKQNYASRYTGEFLIR